VPSKESQNCYFSPSLTWLQADGRDVAESEAANPPQTHSSMAWQRPQNQRFQNPTAPTEICVPQVIHGTLRYTVMEIVPADEPSSGAYWVLRQKAMAPQALPYNAFTTSDTPRPVLTSVGVTGQMAF
jgi:hypothetical protein